MDRISWSVRCRSSWVAPTRRKRSLVCWEKAWEMSGSLSGSEGVVEKVEGVCTPGVEEVEDRRRRTKSSVRRGWKGSVTELGRVFGGRGRRGAGQGVVPIS